MTPARLRLLAELLDEYAAEHRPAWIAAALARCVRANADTEQAATHHETTP